ncbi:MAG: HEAT repeat domain-containing protein, partial [Pseudomonadota bacterium]
VCGCTPPACSDRDERHALRDVEQLVGSDGRLADAAFERLVRRGRSAIAVVETGLYRAEAPGRVRVVRVLGAIGSAEAAPILLNLARRDPDAAVRQEAESALRSLTPN